MWDLPRPGLEPVSPALAGRFLTTAPPGQPHGISFCNSAFNDITSVDWNWRWLTIYTMEISKSYKSGGLFSPREPVVKHQCTSGPFSLELWHIPPYNAMILCTRRYAGCRGYKVESVTVEGRKRKSHPPQLKDCGGCLIPVWNVRSNKLSRYSFMYGEIRPKVARKNII